MTRVACSTAVLALVACHTTSGRGSFIRDAYIRNFDLVIERCVVSVHDDSLDVTDCTTQTQRLPPIAYGTVPAQVAAAGPTREEPATVSRVIASANDALARCARDRRIRGTVSIRLTIDPTGRVTNALPAPGDADFAACVTSAFAAVRLPAGPVATTLSFSVLADDPPALDPP